MLVPLAQHGIYRAPDHQEVSNVSGSSFKAWEALNFGGRCRILAHGSVFIFQVFNL
jgi:hypothetical protein